MNWDALNWQSLDRLRSLFLESAPVSQPYWQSEEDLASYDFTYAQRIAWKWMAVLADLSRLGWRPPSGPMLDWGCGSGVGSRCVLDHFGADGFSALSVHDHAPLAGAFAIARAKERFPRLDVGLASMTAIEGSEPIGTLIVSHVLNELTPDGELSLAAVIRRSESILWVEPGAHAASRRLGRFRESLLTEFRVVSPCSHQSQCGMLTPENARHWCHFFARPPREIFTDPGWSKFARRAGIDLRSLPYSYLILDRRPVNPGAKSVSGLTRVIGEPRVYKGFAKVFGCDETGVRERMLQKRDVPERFAEMKNGDAGALEHWTVINDRIVACKKLESK